MIARHESGIFLSCGLDPGAVFSVLDTYCLECIFLLNKLRFHSEQPLFVFEKVRFAEKHFVTAARDVYYRRAGTGVHGAPVAAEQALDVSPAQQPEAVSTADRASGIRRRRCRPEQSVTQFCSHRSIFFSNCSNIVRQRTPVARLKSNTPNLLS